MEEIISDKQMIEDKIKVHREVMERLNQIAEEYEVQNLIKDNKIEFVHKDVLYRIRKMTLAEREYANKERNRFYLNLVKDKDCMFRDQWIALYKERGIDIRKMEHDISVLQNEIEHLLLSLAETKLPNDIAMFKKNIDTKRIEQAALLNKKGELLDFSIEDQLGLFLNSLTVQLMAEVVESGGKGVRLYKTLDDLKNATDVALITSFYKYANMLSYSDEF